MYTSKEKGGLGVPANEETMFEEWDEVVIQQIMEDAKHIKAYQKKRGREQFHQLIVIDDFGSDQRVSRRSDTLKALAQRGRHLFLSLMVLVQKTMSLHPAIRTQCGWICCFRPSSDQEAISFCREWGNVHPRGAAGLRELSFSVTAKAHLFLLIDLSTSPPTLYHNFKPLQVQ